MKHIPLQDCPWTILAERLAAVLLAVEADSCIESRCLQPIVEPSCPREEAEHRGTPLT